MADTFDRNAPIAVFDSGVGGISVLRALREVMPCEDFFYFGDSAYAPYGTKTTEEVRARVFELVDGFRDKGLKACVVACNTATSAAVRALRETYPEYTIVGIEPALKPAVMDRAGEMPNVIVMATPMTIRNEKFHNLMDRYVEMAHIIPLPCPGLMEFVERGETSGEALYDFISNLLAPFDRDRVDAVVLGCTHYPFVAETVRKVMGEKAVLYEGGPGTARETRRRLEAAGLLTDRTTVGKITIENSLSEEKVKICERLLEM
ncbi:MAG: glutamate racemase [Lachnospiraceae bacterium]|nr:glutamate racemase [Lachnospiraceae bacterium]